MKSSTTAAAAASGVGSSATTVGPEFLGVTEGSEASGGAWTGAGASGAA